MRSVLATHSTSMSWRHLHKIATIFDMPPPVQAMPPRYAIRLQAVTKSAVKVSISEAADQLDKKVDSEPLPEPKAVNIPISFNSSWKTRGYYSKIGFGAAISTTTKKVLDYEILSRIYEKCSIWKEEKQKDKPSEYEKWLERHKPNCNINYTGSSQAMEPEAAERICGRSLERNRLVYSVFIPTIYTFIPLIFKYYVYLILQYTLANPNRGVSNMKKSVPISEFVRISEVVYPLHGEFCSESL